jgi:hypothetical protein
MSELDYGWDERANDGPFAESDDAQAEWDGFHAADNYERYADSVAHDGSDFGDAADYEGWSE